MIYKIGEIAKMLNVSKATIYKWEKSGLIKPFKSSSQHRRFNEKHVAVMRKLLGIK